MEIAFMMLSAALCALYSIQRLSMGMADVLSSDGARARLSASLCVGPREIIVGIIITI